MPQVTQLRRQSRKAAQLRAPVTSGPPSVGHRMRTVPLLPPPLDHWLLELRFKVFSATDLAPWATQCGWNEYISP